MKNNKMQEAEKNILSKVKVEKQKMKW